MTIKTQALQVKLTPEENDAFKKFAEEFGETRSRLVRKIIREIISGGIDLLTDEECLLKFLLRPLYGIGHNINQIAIAVHIGKVQINIESSLLEEINKNVDMVRDEIRQHIIKTKKRWIMCF